MWGYRVGSLPAAGPVPLVLDLSVAHERVGSSSDPSSNGHLRYPNDLDGPLNEAACAPFILTGSSGN